MSTTPPPTLSTEESSTLDNTTVTAAAAVVVAKKTKNQEDELRDAVRKLFAQLSKREPLEPTYKRLLMNGVVTSRKPALPKDKFYKRVTSRLRQRVEKFQAENVGKDPFDRLRQRPPLQDEAMRAAFQLREHKEHEQKPLLKAYLASLPKRQGLSEEAARRRLEGIALGLQNTKWRRQQQQQTPTKAGTTASSSGVTASGKSVVGGSTAPVSLAVEQTEAARKAAEMERQRSEAAAREKARREQARREEELQKRQREMQERTSRQRETPNQVLQKLYKPIFDLMWNLEFDNLGGINPFRMVIDRDNCAVVGAPDYFDVIQEPMNLTWIQQKVERSEYNTLEAFFNDVKLLISNALRYNSDPSNPYRVAALELKEKFKTAAQRLVADLKQKQRQS